MYAMPGHLGSALEGSAQPADSIQAFCRHLGELCDVLSAPYDAEALARAASDQELQGTNCNLLLHNALYHWLGERLELSLSHEGNPDETARRARESALAKVQDQDMLSEFVQAVVSTCTITDHNTTQAPPERGKKSLFFDLQGPIDLLGPEEVDSLLSELTTSDSPVAALETLSSDVHLLEDLCFGPTWPQLCDALGRLVCLPAAATAQFQQTQVPAAPLPRQQQLLLTVLQELASSVAASSPPHAAELLDALAPHLTALVLRMALRPPPGGGGGGSAAAAAPDLLAAAAALDAFAVGLMRVAHRLLAGLAAEFHMLPPGCAAVAARAVCDVVRAGLARGAPAPSAPTAAPPPSADDPLVVDLSALDLLVLLDPELRWWQRLCAATHATQPVADAAAATHLAAALEAALQAWAAAAVVGSSGHSSHGGALAGGVGGGTAAGGRSPTHLLACTALLGGFVRANSLALLGCAPRGDGDVDGGRDGPAASAPKLHLQARPVAAAAAAASQQQRLRLQRMLGHLLSCFCMASDKPWLFRVNGGVAKAAAACAANAGGGGSGGHGGSVFLLLSADVLSSAAALGKLSLLAPAGASGAGAGNTSGVGGGGGGVLTPLLQAMLRAAALTAGAANGATASASEVEAWLRAAARVLGAAAEHAATASETTTTATGAAQRDPSAAQPAAADAMCALLRHIAGRVRGCAAAAASAAPAWALPVVRGAAPLAAASPAVSGALRDLYDTLHAVLSARQPRRAESLSLSSSPTRNASVAGGAGRNGGGGNGDGGGSAQSGAKPRGMSLIDILDSGGALAAEQESREACSASATEPDAVLDDLELLAAEAVMSYCLTDFDAAAADATSAGPPPAVLLQLPAALRRPLLLECAARLLCEDYDDAGGWMPPGGVGGAGSGARGGVAGGLGVQRTAAKRRVARRAGALARCCLAGQQALVAAGFARRVLDDVAAVLRSGEYESPYLEPLPYADPLAGLAAILAGVLCWPGLLRLPEPQEQERRSAGEAGPLRNGGGEAAAAAAAVGGLGAVLEQRHREEVLALLQELVTWLDPRGAEGGGLPPADAAAVSLRAFAALVASDPAAGAALDRDTNIRWYLQSLCGTLPPEEAEEEAAGDRRERRAEGPRGNGAAAGRAAISPGAGGEGDAPQPPAPPPQSDMLLDMAWSVLQATTRTTAAGSV
ncbi:hypothetical protein PLESTM_001334300 [Pleodorina starrii]|nr:hypothetical protein PLESTM_001334300 [Pleodorina starrii]